MVAAIGALTRNHHEYIVCPFLISATCKSKDAHAHMGLLSIVWKACDQMRGTTKGNVTNRDTATGHVTGPYVYK